VKSNKISQDQRIEVLDALKREGEDAGQNTLAKALGI
jgi:hypothetical protein